MGGKDSIDGIPKRMKVDVPGDEVGVPAPLIDAEDGLTEIPSQVPGDGDAGCSIDDDMLAPDIL